MLGSRAALAFVLNAAPDQFDEWLSGTEPDQGVVRLIIDLDHVFARANLVWASDVAAEWLCGFNSHLGGARPLDVLKLRGPSPVLSAMDAAMSGSFS